MFKGDNSVKRGFAPFLKRYSERKEFTHFSEVIWCTGKQTDHENLSLVRNRKLYQFSILTLLAYIANG